MKKSIFTMLTLSFVILSACQPQSKPPRDPLEVEMLPLESDLEKRSYALGASIGHIVEDKINKQKAVEIELDHVLLVQGFIAGMQGKSQLPDKEVKSLNQLIDAQVREKNKAIRAKQTAENKTAGLAFLTENAERAGVIQTESGLQYEILMQGEGRSPLVSDTVKVQYKGTLLNGTEFDSSYARNKPASFPLNLVIKGWTEGVQLMKEGAKFKFYVPSELAYGARSTGKIPGNSTLIFEVELLEITPAG
ncbi:MAG: FKBP-type peptidyl-prolyl cis-trans isomerase [Paraglaciecola sp.]|uniref:FKBP-type peptidyl-prolyl cis-trans isomerase n=1 Tax=Paraglaciecola sp. TaxID=1920173 RepID=UPI0032989E82